MLMGLISGMMVSEHQATLQQATKEKGVAFTTGLALGGWAAIKNNLFLIQETLMSYPKDSDVRSIEIIDPDNLVVAAQIPDRIGVVLDDPLWLQMKSQQAMVFEYSVSHDGEYLLIMVTPLVLKGRTEAWIRVSFSLSRLYREQAQLIFRMAVITLFLIVIGILGLYWSQEQQSLFLRTLIRRLLETRETLGGTLGGKSLQGQGSHFVKSPEFSRRGDVERLEESVTKIINLLNDQSQALRDSTLLLEKRVMERTHAMQESSVALAQEVQGRRLAQETLEKVHRQNRLILESVGEGIYGVDLDGRVTFVNPAGAEMLGFHVEGLLGQIMHDYIHHTRSDGGIYGISDCRLHGDIQKGMSRHSGIETFWRNDGTYFPVEYVRTPIYEHGEVVGTVISFNDITQRQKAESIIQENERRIRQSQKMEAIGTLAGGIAHDFNNILMAISGYCELIKFKLPPNEKVQWYIDQVMASSFRAKELVNQILMFSRQREHQQDPIPLRVVIQEVLSLLKATLPSTILIHDDFSHEDGIALVDHTQFHQVFMNLCANAEHAMRGIQGHITISLGSIVLKPHVIERYGGLSPGQYLRLTVSDTGPGIPQEIISRIFDPFFTTKEVGEGTGMGLSVVHGIIASHNGTITVESPVGEGTTFIILLPQITDVSLAKSEVHYDAALMGSGHVLFVDDEESLSLLGEEMLHHLGYQVTTYTNPLKALEHFRSDPNQFDAVLSDQTMPNLTGEVFVQELLRIRPEIPILIYTGFSHTFSPEKAHALGVRHVLMKPVNIPELARVLHDVLHDSREERNEHKV